MKNTSATDELRRLKLLLDNYEELLTDNIDDDAYVARGNGFCDSKYSDGFIEGQIAAIRRRVAELESQSAVAASPNIKQQSIEPTI